MNTGKLILGVVAGVALGASLGILFAPDKGTATRKKISKKRSALTEDLERKFNRFIDGFKKKFEDLQEEASDMVEDMKVRVKETQEQVTTEKA
ncbi:MAG: YtxH domain-containing protein [Lentimicrobium sp.]